MSRLVTVRDVLDAVETDLQDSVLSDYIEDAEADLTEYLSSTERSSLPVQYWSGAIRLDGVTTTGQAEAGTVRSATAVRIAGFTDNGGVRVAFYVDTNALNSSGSGTADLIPILSSGTAYSAGAFTASVDPQGEITFTWTGTAAYIEITSIVGQAILGRVGYPQYRKAVLDLVRLAVRYTGVQTERVGDYSETLRDYHDERNKVLARLVYAGSTSLVR